MFIFCLFISGFPERGDSTDQDKNFLNDKTDILLFHVQYFKIIVGISSRWCHRILRGFESNAKTAETM